MDGEEEKNPASAVAEAVQEAEQQLAAGDTDAARDTLAELRAELAAHKEATAAELAALRGDLDKRASSEHLHDLPPPLSDLARDWAELEAAERSPDATHKRYRKLWGE